MIINNKYELVITNQYLRKPEKRNNPHLKDYTNFVPKCMFDPECS